MSEKNEWKVSSNPVDGKTMYQVVKVIDDGKPENSGNRKVDSIWDNRKAAELRATFLNIEEASKK